MWVDNAYYTEDFGGIAVDAANFTRFSREAEAKVRYYTFGRIDQVPATDATLIEQIKIAICAVIEHQQVEVEKQALQQADRRVSSESVGSHSISYKYGDEIANRYRQQDPAAQDPAYVIIATHLMHTGLMYRGVL